MSKPPSYKQAKTQIKRLNEELEQCVVERTRELTAANEELRREIIERRRIEEALHESEERFRRYFELGLIGMAITSPTKGFIEVNDQMCEILGYERSELLQMTWEQLTHRDDLAADVVNFNQALAGKIDGDPDGQKVDPQGRPGHSCHHFGAMRASRGRIGRLLRRAVARTPQPAHRAEEALRETSEQLRALSACLRSAREEEGRA